MKSRSLFTLIVAFIINISSADASGLLDETDLLEGSGKGCGKVIAFRSAKEGQRQEEELTPKNNEKDAALAASEVRPAERKQSGKNNPSGGFEFLPLNAACLLLVILVCSIARLIR